MEALGNSNYRYKCIYGINFILVITYNHGRTCWSGTTKFPFIGKLSIYLICFTSYPDFMGEAADEPSQAEYRTIRAWLGHTCVVFKLHSSSRRAQGSCICDQTFTRTLLRIALSSTHLIWPAEPSRAWNKALVQRESTSFDLYHAREQDYKSLLILSASNMCANHGQVTQPNDRSSYWALLSPCSEFVP